MPTNVPNQTLPVTFYGGTWNSAPEPVTPPTLVGLADPTLATNPTGVDDYTPSYPFIDLFKQSRPFSSPTVGNLAALRAGGYMEADGWPGSIPPAGQIQATYDWTSLAGTYYGGERFTLTWDGTGTVSLFGGMSVVSSTANSIVFDLNADPSSLGIQITATDPAPNNVRNIQLIADKFRSNYDAGELINPDYVQFLSDMRLLRFMDWGQTNWSIMVNWSDRTTAAWPQFTNEGSGTETFQVPYEYAIELCNRTKSDMWVCFPHMATDDFVVQLATLVRDTLDPDLVCHFELSNEVWNFGFPHWQYFRDLGYAQWPGASGENDYRVALNAQGKRAAECAALVDTVYSGILSRRENVIGTFNNDITETTTDVLDAPFWQTYDPGTYVAPHSVVQAAAVAPYYGTGLYNNEAEVAAAYASGTHLTYIYNWMLDPANESSIPGMVSNLNLQKGVTDARSIKLIQYEGLRHYLHGSLLSGDALTAALEFSDSAEDADLAIRAWEAWELVGDGPLQVFSDIVGKSGFGAWGLVEYYGETSPYAEALVTLSAFTPNWWGGTTDYRHEAPTGATDYYPPVGSEKPVSGGIGTYVTAAKYQVFGHSLFTYTGGDVAVATPYTRAGEWLGLLAGEAGLSSVGSYTFGQYADHNARTFVPASAMLVTGTYDIGNTTPFVGDYSGQNYTHFLSMPSSFLETDVGPPPFDNDPAYIVGQWSQLDDNIDISYPGADHILYVHWPDAGNYSVEVSDTRADFITYNNAVMDETPNVGWLGWHIETQNALVAAGRNPRVWPVGPIIAWIFNNVSGPDTLLFDDVYGDSAPHGTENIYFLAGLVCFRILYGPNPDITGFTFPGAATQMRSEITSNLAAIDAAVISRIAYHSANGVRVF